MSTQRNILTAGPLLLSIGLAAQTAYAQSEEDEIILEPITVEGAQSDPYQYVEGYAAEASVSANRGLPSDLATAPRSVSVITDQQITDQGAMSIEEAIAYTPGVTTQTYGADGRYDQFAIRGFSAHTSGIYRDGMPLRTYGWGAWRTETFGLERIEVLRGATSSLYGSNEPGGLVNAITKRPKFEHNVELLARTSAYGGLEMGVDVTDALSDTVAYRFVGLAGKTGTIYDEVDESRLYFAPSLTWSPSDLTNLTLFAQYQKDEVGDTYVLVPQYGSQLPNPLGQYDNDFYSNNPDRNTIETTQSYVGYEFDHELENGLTFRSRARYADNDWTNKTGYASTFFSSRTIYGLPPISEAINAATLVNFDVDQNTKQLTFDNALVQNLSFGNVEATVIGGIDYYRGKYDNTYAFGYGGTKFLETGEIVNLPGIPTTPTVLTATQDVKQTGLYLMGNFNIGDNIIVDAGLRHDWLDMSGSSGSSFGSYSLSSKKNFTSGNLGVSYNFDNGVTIFGAASRSFNLPPAGFSSTGQPLDVEMANSFEVGTRFRPLGTNSLLSVTLFDITKTNALQAVPGFPGAFEQVGEVRSQGVEVGANYAFQNGISVLASYTFIDAKVTKNTTDQGNRLGNIPEHSASIWVDYAFDQVPGLRAGLGIRYTGERFSDNANTQAFKLDDVTILDASINYERNGWVTTLAARNLADKRYVSYCQSGDPSGLPPTADPAQSAGCTFGTGRTVELSLTRHF
ncbi:MAG: TonB-dependent siderophore receptor [Rhodobacteraceae bacterium]|nr:TonB-dependent siderophore receptor [Paracoccaceae bacterium]